MARSRLTSFGSLCPILATRYGLPPTRENLEKQLRSLAQRLSGEAISFAAPTVRVVYKNIAPESVRDPNFLASLRKNMERRGVPNALIDSLFASSDAAPAARTKAPAAS